MTKQLPASVRALGELKWGHRCMIELNQTVVLKNCSEMLLKVVLNSEDAKSSIVKATPYANWFEFLWHTSMCTSRGISMKYTYYSHVHSHC